MSREKEYEDFLSQKKKQHIHSGFDCNQLNKHLRPDQDMIVKRALKAGRFAVFADTGLGKTIMQLAWLEALAKHTGRRQLLLTILGVVEQTIEEAEKFGIDMSLIDVNNYEQLDNIDIAQYVGVALDESSILKAVDGKTSRKLIDAFRNTPYKSCWTATPSPNDHTELGMHSEFLGAMSYHEMLAMFFVHDGGETSKWRLRKHAETDFWNYVLSWSIAIDNPKTFGYEIDGFDLPKLNIIEHEVLVEKQGLDLFGEAAVSATELHGDFKLSMNARIEKAIDIINEKPNDQWVIWALQNEEAKRMAKQADALNIQGSDKPEVKAKSLASFRKGETKRIVTKAKIAAFGQNWQKCHNMIFLSYDFSFESFYQQVRRCYRYGQTEQVNVHIIKVNTQANVLKGIKAKEKKHIEKVHNLAVKSYQFEEFKKENKQMEDVKTDKYWLMNGDCVERTKDIESESIDYTFFSPPFGALYVFSDNEKDISNVKDDDEFYKHFSFLPPQLLRITKPGRLCSMHIMQGTTSIGKDGFFSIKDFRGELIRIMQMAGWIFHAEKMIRKDPQLAAIRTKNHQLMHGSILKDSSIARPGLADFIITFRKPGKNEIPIKNNIPFDLWCKLAEPVWLDIDASDILKNYRKGRENNDERHLTPTQLKTIENCLLLWSNEGETIFSPFGGIGSEGFQAIKMKRKSISIELKESYFRVNVENHKAAVFEDAKLSLF